jgi:hypothetical protein
MNDVEWLLVDRHFLRVEMKINEAPLNLGESNEK